MTYQGYKNLSPLSFCDLENEVKDTQTKSALKLVPIIYPGKFGKIPSPDSRDIMVTRIYHADPDDAVNADTEECVYIQLEEYLVNKDLLFDCQSGFRSRYSTDTCSAYLTDYIKTQTSEGLNTGMVMLDLQKAFDAVDHYILCKK